MKRKTYLPVEAEEKGESYKGKVAGGSYAFKPAKVHSGTISFLNLVYNIDSLGLKILEF